MPIDLVLVRHGESEGNVANRRSRAGDHSAYTPEFRQRPSAHWRLTERGRAQARVAGAWLRTEIVPSRPPTAQVFDRHYTSEYIRAMETAALLELPHATWYLDPYLRERDFGQLDVMPDAERRARFADEVDRRERDGFYWAPPGGESMASVCLRVDRVLHTLHRECSDHRVVIICHGETMVAFRMRIERITQRRYHELVAAEDTKAQIHNVQNCEVFHYSRRDPASRELASHYRWVRSVCPWDPSRSRNVWEPIARPRFSNADLLAEAAVIPQLIDNPSDLPDADGGAER